LISTGGTISRGVDPETGEETKLGAQELINLIPDIKEKITVECLGFCQIPSNELDLDLTFSLGKTINQRYLDDPNLSGIVVTHGTDTLEETAFLLWLTIKDPRPVVLTAAQRPPKEGASDATRNLRDALLVASHIGARDKGVMVCLNHEINSARYVRKTDTWALQSFSSGGYGKLGCVDKEHVMFFEKPVNRLTLDVEKIDTDVDLIKVTQGITSKYVDASIKSGVQGIVVEATGRGFAPKPFLDKLHEAVKKGIIVVMVSRCFEGRIDIKKEHIEAGIVNGEDLDGLKARILLCLLLSKHRDPSTIQRFFDHLSGKKALE
jgi:L-asparaginase